MATHKAKINYKNKFRVDGVVSNLYWSTCRKGSENHFQFDVARDILWTSDLSNYIGAVIRDVEKLQRKQLGLG
jgi:hypothetical protein